MSSACCPHGPQLICTSFPWSLETGDDIENHICHQHIIYMSSPRFRMWSPLTQIIHRLFPLSQIWSSTGCPCGPWCGPYWYRSSTGCSHCLRCCPHQQRSSSVNGTTLGTMEMTCEQYAGDMWSLMSSIVLRDHGNDAQTTWGPWGWCAATFMCMWE